MIIVQKKSKFKDTQFSLTPISLYRVFARARQSSTGFEHLLLINFRPRRACTRARASQQNWEVRKQQQLTECLLRFLLTGCLESCLPALMYLIKLFLQRWKIYGISQLPELFTFLYIPEQTRQAFFRWARGKVK